METVAAIIVFAVVIAAMAVGVMVMKKPISGSCGGLNNLDGQGGRCDICGATAQEAKECRESQSSGSDPKAKSTKAG
jgi:hypothetical protein